MRGRSLGSCGFGSAARARLRSRSNRARCTVSDTANTSSRLPNSKIATRWKARIRYAAARARLSDSRKRAWTGFRSTLKGRLPRPVIALLAIRRLSRTSMGTSYSSVPARASVFMFGSDVVTAAAIPIDNYPPRTKAIVSAPQPHTTP
jgi:hypothetical protein